MLDKKVFSQGLEMLVIEYGEKGFTMPKERAAQWYSFFQNMSEKAFMKRIDECLRYCTKAPTMADVLMVREETRANVGAYEIINYGDDN